MRGRRKSWRQFRTGSESRLATAARSETEKEAPNRLAGCICFFLRHGDTRSKMLDPPLVQARPEPPQG